MKVVTYLYSVDADCLQWHYLDGSRRSIRLTNKAKEAAKQHVLHQMPCLIEKEAQKLAHCALNGLYRCQKAQRWTVNERAKKYWRQMRY